MRVSPQGRAVREVYEASPRFATSENAKLSATTPFRGAGVCFAVPRGLTRKQGGRDTSKKERSGGVDAARRTRPRFLARVPRPLSVLRHKTGEMTGHILPRWVSLQG